MTFSDQNWTELAALAQGGDKRAYAELLKGISVFTRNILIYGLSNRDWAEDITQDVLISVHKSLGTYSPDKPFRPWLSAIIQFRRTDFLRAQYRARANMHVQIESADIDAANVTMPAHSDECMDIETALKDLPEKQRSIVKMMKIQGYTAEEVAMAMDMNVSAVKVSAHRALAKMKERLA
jgi:RNA polymerase sigma-70 factor (ECF subfamily)